MRVAILTPDHGGCSLALSNFFASHALQKTLGNHNCTTLFLGASFSGEQIGFLESQDKVLLCAEGVLDSLADRNPTAIESIAGLTNIVPLGLSARKVNNEFQLADRSREILSHWHANGGKISVRDPSAEGLLNPTLSGISTRVTGCPSILLRESGVSSHSGVIFCPPSPDSVPRYNSRDFVRKVSRLYRSLVEREKTLFLSFHREDECFGALPGISTLFAVRFPIAQVRAIASASLVVSFRIEPVLLALGNRVPAILLGIDSHDIQIAQMFGVPVLFIGGEFNSKEIANSLQYFREHYPSKEVYETIEEFENRLVEHLYEHDLLSSPSLRREVPERIELGGFKSQAKRPLLSVCCISDWEYLPSLLGLVENLKSVHGDNFQLHFLSLDRSVESFLRRTHPQLDICFYNLSDLWDVSELQKVQSRPVPLQAYSSKSRLLMKALHRVRGPVFYFDTDLYFFRSPQRLIHDLEGGSVLLFPHWNHSLPHSRLHGLFNAGMILVSPGAEPFLSWWSELCLFRCTKRASEGYFVDQGYLDMAPVFFDTVRIYRGADENVAPWNVATLGLVGKEGSGVGRAGEVAIGSFHASGSDEAGFYETKFVWDQLVTYFSDLNDPEKHRTLYMNVLTQQKDYHSRLKKLFHLFATLRNRFGMRGLILTPRVVRFLSSGIGYQCLSACSNLYDLLRRQKNFLISRFWQPSPCRDEMTTSFWISLQRRMLTQRRLKTEARPKSWEAHSTPQLCRAEPSAVIVQLSAQGRKPIESTIH